MSSPDEFRAFARECLRWAEETSDEKHREVLLDLAKQWMHAALQTEKTIDVIADDAPLLPKDTGA